MINKKYKILDNNCFYVGEFCLVPIRSIDIEKIRLWRNEQKNILRQKNNITKTEQVEYFRNNIWPLFDEDKPSQLLFSFLKKDVLIGYGGIVHIDWEDKRAEVSFLVDTDITKNKKDYQELFKVFLDILFYISFDKLNLNRLTTETYDLRPFHIEVYDWVGLKQEGRLKKHVFINGEFIDSLVHACLKSEYILASSKTIVNERFTY